jgi:ATP-dependent protease ClpP protease subunit
MSQIEAAKTAWRRRWEARQRGMAVPAAPIPPTPAPRIQQQPPPRVHVEPLSEGEYDQAKARWRGQHRWREPPPTCSVTLSGDIDDEVVDGIARTIGRDPLAPICLAVTSQGGDPRAAQRLYHCLREHAAPIAIDVTERCASAALLVLMGGDARTAAADAKFALHHVEYAIPRTGRHTASFLRESASHLEGIDEDMVWILALRSRYAEWQIRADMANEVVLTAEKAWLRGLLTEPPR